MPAPREPAPQAIREQLQRVLTSPGFLHSERLRRFLTHCVEATLSGRVEDLKEYAIGVAAFDRPTHYNPAEDPIVRVEARRLRRKLDEYYLTHGAADPIVIQLPKGGYLPLFEVRTPEAAAVPEVVHPAVLPWRYRMVIGAACVLTVSVLCVWWFGHRPALPELALSRLTSDRGLTTDPALSPDGSLLAYASDRAGTGGLDIWIQSVASPPGNAPRQLTGDPADDSQPAISPDRSTVAFRSERQPPGVYVVPVAGGPARLLAPEGRNPRYSPDGRWIAYWVGALGGDSLPPAGKAFVMPAGGGDSRRLLPRTASAACPIWSPEGRSLLVEAIETPADGFDLRTASLSDERSTATGIARTLEQAHLRFALRECSLSWGRDALVFSALDGDTQSLWRLPLLADGRPAGQLVRSTYGSAAEALPFVAASDVIAFAGRSESLSIWRLPVDPPGELTRITQGVASATFPQVRGEHLTFLSKTGGGPAVWLQDLRSGQAAPITSGGEPQYPNLCPDGKTVVYSEGPNTFTVSATSPHPHLLCNGCARVWQCTGQGLFFVPAGSKTPVPIDEFRLPDGPGIPLLVSAEHDLASAQKSSDGWLAFHAITGPSQRQILVAPYHPGAATPPGEWIPVTSGSQMDRNAVWNERSDTLYFLSERCGFRCIWSQRLDSTTKKPVGEPVAVRHFHSARQGLSAIGDVGAIGLGYVGGFLYFAQAEQAGDVWLARPVSHESKVRKQ